MNPLPAQDAPAALTLALIAGYRPDGEAIMEQLRVEAVPDSKSADEYRLLTSPGFVRGLASGDRIRHPVRNEAGYELLKRSGNLSIRVLRKDNLDLLAQALTPEIELLDGSLDLQTPAPAGVQLSMSPSAFRRWKFCWMALSDSSPDRSGYYGNVYDPTDGVTPLDWWQDFLAPV